MKKEGKEKGIKGEESEREEWRVLHLLLVECMWKYGQAHEIYPDHYPGLGILIEKATITQPSPNNHFDLSQALPTHSQAKKARSGIGEEREIRTWAWKAHRNRKGKRFLTFTGTLSHKFTAENPPGYL